VTFALPLPLSPKPLAVAALALAGALALTACGGSNGSASDKITGSPSATSATSSTSPSATATTAAAAGAPTITLPADVHVEITDPGAGKDAATTAAVAGLKYAILALRDGYAQGSGEVPSMLHAYGTQAGLYWSKLIKEFSDQGKTTTGTYGYYDLNVTLTNATSGSATYCEDQRLAYAKVRKTGEVLRTSPSNDDFFLNTVQLSKDAQGVWKVNNVVWEKGNASCVRS
jgi:hypothetical protein